MLRIGICFLSDVELLALFTYRRRKDVMTRWQRDIAALGRCIWPAVGICAVRGVNGIGWRGRAVERHC